MIVSFWPVHSVAVAQEDKIAYTAWQTGDLILNYGTLVKPNPVSFEPTLLDKAEKLLSSGYKEQCVIAVKKLLGITKSLGFAGNLKVSKMNGEIGDIVKIYWNHVGVVIGKINGNYLIFDCNFDYKGTCRIMETQEVLGFIEI